MDQSKSNTASDQSLPITPPPPKKKKKAKDPAGNDPRPLTFLQIQKSSPGDTQYDDRAEHEFSMTSEFGMTNKTENDFFGEIFKNRKFQKYPFVNHC